MTTPLPVGPLTPYVTPELLVQAPTGIAWASIPAGGIRSGVTDASRTAALANICATATGLVDLACKQPLRATIDPLLLYGPGVRVGVDQQGRRPTSLILKRWPVLEVISVQVSPNCLPWNWVTVPPSDYAVAYPPAGLYDSSAPPGAGEGSQQILLAPRWVNWSLGHDGYAIQVQHVNGWPHCGLTAAAAPVTGDTPQTIQVDDCTGWAAVSPLSGFTGATGTVYDAGNQEVVQCTAASAASGPGTLTLASPLQFDHAAGVMVSTLPETVVWAAILFCCSQALTRGATSTTVLQAPGGKSEGGSVRAQTLAKQAKDILAPFARII